MSALPVVELGRSGLRVPCLGLGCMGMSEWYGPTDDAESTQTIHRALELGITFLDTADVYGRGHNERLVGAALAGGRRDGVVVATKFGTARLATWLEREGINATAIHGEDGHGLALGHLHGD